MQVLSFSYLLKEGLHAFMAQLAGQTSVNRQVVGSSPTERAIRINYLGVSMILNEMSIKRNEAFSKCIDLSAPFIEHFSKVYDEGVGSPTFHHHCSEMQNWWNTVNNFVFRHNNKRISQSELIDWFFLGGSDTETLFKGNPTKEDVYNDFMIEMLYRRDTSNVEDVLYNILLRYGV